MQKIRLTEGDLHQIIKESVKKCLNELDWRTYSNAADEADRRARMASYNSNYESNRTRNRENNRSARFLDASRKSIRDEKSKIKHSSDFYDRIDDKQLEYYKGGYRYNPDISRWVANPMLVDKNGTQTNRRAWIRKSGYRDNDGDWHRAEFVKNY